MHKLKEAKMLSVWFIGVTVPFYVQSIIFVYFVKQSLENGKRVSSQSIGVLYDVFFMIVVPLAIVVYSKRSKSQVIILYLYSELTMTLYSLYLRWHNNWENLTGSLIASSEYRSTDSVRIYSSLLTVSTIVYLI